MTNLEIGHIAGLLEGEGSFISDQSIYHYPLISVKMTDQDVLEQLSSTMGPAVHSKARVRVEPDCPSQFIKVRKPVFVYQLHGCGAAGWMMTLYKLMGIRRKAQIKKALRAWAPKYRRHF